MENKEFNYVECEHCSKQIPCSDDLGVQEHCDYCGFSIFISSEEIIELNLNNMKKEIKSTLENFVIYNDRCCGNSTRQIDNAIQLLFKGYIVKVEDHYELGNHRKANINLFNRIYDRLHLEHSNSNLIDKIRFNRDKLTIEFK